MSDLYWPDPRGDNPRAVAREARNPPGERSVDWRLGTYAEYRDRMLAALPASRVGAGRQWLRHLNAAAGGRFASALVEAWAMVGEVISFYQARIVDEGYLGTAVEARSVHAFSEGAGYRPAPGISAEVWLAVEIQEGLGHVRLPERIAVESTPLPGEDALVFETVAAAEMHPAWNRLIPTTQPDLEQVLVGEVPVERADGVGPGTVLLVEVAGEATPCPVVVESVADDGGPVLKWTPAEPEAPDAGPRSVKSVTVLDRAAPLFGHLLPQWDRADMLTRLAAGGTFRGGLFVGQTPYLLMEASAPVRAICVDAEGRFFLGTAGEGVLRSDDGGASWSTASKGLDFVDVLSLTRDSAQGLYAGTLDGGVFRSTDAGLTWESINRPNVKVRKEDGAFIADSSDSPTAAVRALAVHGSGARAQVLVGTNRGAFRSVDGGETWVPFDTLPPVVTAVAADAHRLVVATEEGLYVSPTDTIAWTLRDDDLPEPVDCVALQRGRLYVGTRGAGVYTSKDDGATWSAAGLAESAVSALAAGPGGLAAAVPGSLRLSRTGGRRWEEVVAVDGLIDVGFTPQGDAIGLAPRQGFRETEWPGLLPGLLPDPVSKRTVDLDDDALSPAVGDWLVAWQTPEAGLASAEGRGAELREAVQVERTERVARRDPGAGVVRQVTRIQLKAGDVATRLDPRVARIQAAPRALTVRVPRSEAAPGLFDGEGSTRLRIAGRIPPIPAGRVAWLVGRRRRVKPVETPPDAPPLVRALGSPETQALLPEEFPMYLGTPPGATGPHVQRDSGFVGALSVPAAGLLPAEDGDPTMGQRVHIVRCDIHNTYTMLTLDTTPSLAFDASTLTLFGNAVLASHGETVQEVLGDGRAESIFQEFRPGRSPISRRPASTGTGSESTLEVRVADAAWRAVEGLRGADPEARIFMERVDEAGRSTVTFGDGKRGRRLPSGADNVRARYQVGSGAAGNLRAGQLTSLSRGSALVSAVHNPGPASKGADPESGATTRDLMPRWVRAAGRVISATDVEDYLLTLPEIDRAEARVVPGRRGLVQLTVVGPGGASVDHDLVLRTFAAVTDPGLSVATAFSVLDPRRAFFRLAGRLVVDAFELPPVVEAAEAALRARFSFAHRPFDAPVDASEVVATLHGVPGVVAVFLDRLALHPTEDTTVLSTRLAMPRTAEQAAGLLLLDPSPEAVVLTASRVAR